jgi:hypothetical protein
MEPGSLLLTFSSQQCRSVQKSRRFVQGLFHVQEDPKGTIVVVGCGACSGSCRNAVRMLQPGRDHRKKRGEWMLQCIVRQWTFLGNTTGYTLPSDPKSSGMSAIFWLKRHYRGDMTTQRALASPFGPKPRNSSRNQLKANVPTQLAHTFIWNIADDVLRVFASAANL